MPRTRAVKRKNKIDERQSAHPLMQIDETGVPKSKIRNNAINIPLNLEFFEWRSPQRLCSFFFFLEFTRHHSSASPSVVHVAISRRRSYNWASIGPYS